MRSPLRRCIRPLASRGLAASALIAACGVLGAAQTQQPVQPVRSTTAPATLPPLVKTASIAGRVTAPNGAAISRARVVLTARELFECPPYTDPTQTDGCPRYSRITLTDAEGRWLISELPKGTSYAVHVTKTGYVDQSFGATPATPEPPPIVLLDGEKKVGVDMTLAAATSLSGRLFDTDKTPFAAALVEARRVVDDPTGPRLQEPPSQAVTGIDGRFRIAGLAPGRYVISASDPAFSGAGTDKGAADFGQTFYPGTRERAAATPVDVLAKDATEPITFTLLPSTVVRMTPPPDLAAPSAQVLPAAGAQSAPRRPVQPPPTAALSGRITSLATGAPIANARVIVSGSDLVECPAGATPGSTDDCPRHTRVALTGTDGRYTVDKLPRGKQFVVTVTRSGFAPRAWGEVPPAGAPRFIELRDGEQKAQIDIALAPENTVSGAVLDEDETPMAGAVVEAQRAIYDENGRRQFITAAETISDDRGEFRLSALGPGQYFITAFDPSYAGVGDREGQLFYGPTFYPGTVFQDDAVRVTLEPGLPVEGLKFKLEIIRPARLKGRLIAPGLQLLAGAVNIGPSRSNRSGSFATSEADIKPDGVFQFANILAERYAIRARAAVEKDGVSHFALWTQPVEGVDVSEVDMTLAPGARIDGRVIWESRSTPKPADTTPIRVRAPMADGSSFGDVLSGKIDPDGRYSLMGAMAGYHYIRIENLPEPWGLKQVNWQGADITDIQMPLEYRKLYTGMDIVLTDVTTTLQGTVAVAANDLAQGYAVIAFPRNRLHWHPVSRYIKLAYVDDRGRYVIKGLPPAEYFVAVTRMADESDLTNNALLDSLAVGAVTVRLSDGERRNQPLIAVKSKR